MKIEGNTVIFERLIEANTIRKGEGSSSNQAVSVPEPAAMSSCVNAKGSFSSNLDKLKSNMKALSARIASLDLPISSNPN